jgi:histidinol-phosphate phosphatase family protein
MSKTVFLDRDGVINRIVGPHCYVTSWDEFETLPGVVQAIKQLNEAHYQVIIVSNQRGIARGKMTLLDVTTLHETMCETFAKEGTRIDGIYLCPHEEGECTCRKPNIGLFLQAEQDFAIDKSESWMIGDSESDVEAGQRYGVKTIQSSNLLQAVSQILKTPGTRAGAPQ